MHAANPHLTILRQFLSQIPKSIRLSILLSALPTLPIDLSAAPASGAADLAWPPITRDCRPMAYWWWMGSAVDRTNLTRELQRYHDAGMGGTHIIPIYGAKDWRSRYIDYLSPQWMELLRYTVTEGQRLDLSIDLTTGTGWCFGGPEVTDQEANANVVAKLINVPPGEALAEKFDPRSTQALVAFGPEGQCVELTGQIHADGSLSWKPAGGTWSVYAVSQQPSGVKVKRAAPGGAGHMLNLFYGPGMRHYLERFEKAFAAYTGPKPRAMYHDSYEYNSNWAPDLFEQFERRRGYRLQTELPALLGNETNDPVARVKGDYRETLSDLLAEVTLPQWVRWCHEHGMLTRNQAHGSPGNLLDLYALADIPETEMFNKDRSKLVSKFASSAAHVAGHRLVAAEIGTWLQEHFQGTLGDMKHLLDDLFLSGVNQVVYHGTCYSPDEVSWPGWQFYVSFEMNPRNSLWRDVPALNAYAARCQSLLQQGEPDNDILLYWPIHDLWHNSSGLEQKLTVHSRGWLDDQPIGAAASCLYNRGYTFDYLSDRQVAASTTGEHGRVRVPGGHYRVVVVPECQRMPLLTLQKLLALAETGATIIFQKQIPQDVPGWGDLAARRAALKQHLNAVRFAESPNAMFRQARFGQGRVLAGDLEAALEQAGVKREPMVDSPGILFLRRSDQQGLHYFVANRGDKTFEGWLPLSTNAKSVVILDPLSGRTGYGTVRQPENAGCEVLVSLQAGESLILRALAIKTASEPAWCSWEAQAEPVPVLGNWTVRFVAGGPQLPPPFSTVRLASWTELGGVEAQRFAGTAAYTCRFDAPPGAAERWILDLGKVCQSARVRLNGQDQGTLLIPPFQVVVEGLRPTDNELEVEVTNVSANRIRDLDRRHVAWKNFLDINYVDINYKPFDASAWPLRDSGLLGPVTLTPVKVKDPRLK